MALRETVTHIDLSKQLKHLSTGKVRELYQVDESTVLFVATDRVSAFDVLLRNGIPDKGVVLTQLTAHWFTVLKERIPSLQTHLKSLDLPDGLVSTHVAGMLQQRSMQVKKLNVLPLESIVRGYITGSAWVEYQNKGTVHGIKMPAGLQECQKLDEPLWTPSTKAGIGEHDENISPERAAHIVGKEYADQIAQLSVQIYTAAREYAAERGIIIADTKFEFGLDNSTSPPSLVLVDEVLSPDSSRFWDAGKYVVGQSQEGLDKQYLRDWLTSNNLKGKEGVCMPQDVVVQTRKGYLEAYERLTGTSWPGLNVLLIGNGGREHALAWKLAQSPHVDQIFVCPGNGGTVGLRKTQTVSSIRPDDFAGLARFANRNNIDLLIPGPEQPLVDGIVDTFNLQAPKIKCFGPSAAAARMEGSKTFSKDFMNKYNIPTARYCNFSDYDAAARHLHTVDYNVVIKASGLAAGKGVIIPANKQEAVASLKNIMLDKAFGEAGDRVVIEELLEGHEISILSFSDGVTIKSLPPAQDHKRIFDEDKGPNTGGMGTYAPAPLHIIDKQALEMIEKTILKPTIEGMRNEGFAFVGCLFTGLMMTQQGPKVLEYNVRLGDPETQSLLALLESDLAEILMAAASGRLSETRVSVMDRSAATVVVAAAGYPAAYQKGTKITLDPLPDDVVLFHAGTLWDGPNLVTAGGRVIAATATAESLEKAISRAYEGVGRIHFQGMQYRKDVGAQALR